MPGDGDAILGAGPDSGSKIHRPPLAGPQIAPCTGARRSWEQQEDLDLDLDLDPQSGGPMAPPTARRHHC